MVTPEAPAANQLQQTDVLIVGGGPAGLASAIMFAKNGCKVTVAERNSEVTYSDPDRSYVYAIDGRGQQFTDKYDITPKLADASVDALDVSVTRVFPSGKSVTNRQVIKDKRRLVYWLPRSSFMRLLEDEASHGQYAAYISVLRSTEASDITRDADGQLSVTLANTRLGSSMTFRPKLVLGCDGINSVVRNTLQAWTAPQAASNGRDRFGMVLAPSLSTNLRFKVLQLPANPAMVDGTVLTNASFCLLAGQKAPLIGGPPLRLGLLPIKDPVQGRTANLITLPDHPVWNVTDGETMYQVFAQAFPQANWRQLVPETVMNKFAASTGGSFPAPQYSNGLTMALAAADAALAGQQHDAAAAGGSTTSALKGTGVALIGDAAHCFPPDLGQGVNSALEDVCVLERQLFDSAAGDLSQALPAFEQQRLPDSAALVKLVQIGFPLQYNQYPLLRALWNIRFMAQVLAHKLLPFLVSPPLFLMIQDPQQSYSSVLAATERSRRVLYVLAAALVAGIAWLLQKLFLKSAGVAA